MVVDLWSLYYNYNGVILNIFVCGVLYCSSCFCISMLTFMTGTVCHKFITLNLNTNIRLQGIFNIVTVFLKIRLPLPRVY